MIKIVNGVSEKLFKEQFAVISSYLRNKQVNQSFYTKINTVQQKQKRIVLKFVPGFFCRRRS